MFAFNWEKLEAAKKNKQVAAKKAAKNKKRKKLKRKPLKRCKLKCRKLQQRRGKKLLKNQKKKQRKKRKKSVKKAAENAKKEKIEAAKKNKHVVEKEKKEIAEKEAVEKKLLKRSKLKCKKAVAKKSEEAEMQCKKPKGKRITKPSLYLKSPFMNKMVKTQDKLHEDEILCARSVFCMQGDISEVVFDDGKGTTAHRKEMQSLAPGIEIEKQIIDTLVTVLNYKERIRADGKDLRRRYFPTVLLNEEKDQAKEYESFENVIKNQINASGSKKKMKDVELTFFPTVAADGQYYVIVFNLLKANAVILDNQKDDDYIRGSMSGYAKKFSEDNKDEEKVKKMVEDAINRKIRE
ncbi:hypothetical protein Tco_0412332 [Tanacetum coccineum]